MRTGSWSLPLGFFSTTSSIDSIAVRITSGDPFSPEAMADFNVAGWSEGSNEGMFATATGSGTNMLGFTLHFSGILTAPVQFDVAAFSNGVLIGAIQGDWSGNGHFVSFSDSNWNGINNSTAAPVPSPSSLLLGMIGLALIGLVRFRFL